MQEVPDLPSRVSLSIQEAQLPHKVLDLLLAPHDRLALPGILDVLVDVGEVPELDGPRHAVHGGLEMEAEPARLQNTVQLRGNALHRITLPTPVSINCMDMLYHSQTCLLFLIKKEPSININKLHNLCSNLEKKNANFSEN